MTSLLRELRESGFEVWLRGAELHVIPSPEATEEHRRWITDQKSQLFDELKNESGWERLTLEEFPPGLPEDEEVWEREQELSEFQPTYQFREPYDPSARGMELQVAFLNHQLAGSLVRKNQKSQRTNASGARYRAALTNWRSRECRIRKGGFEGCIRGVYSKCEQGQVVWCSHCRQEIRSKSQTEQ